MNHLIKIAILISILFGKQIMGQDIKSQNKSSAISEERAVHTLQISREAQWTFPSSLGRPISKENPDWLERIKNEQFLFPDAVNYFLENGKIDEACELAANVWRLWVLEHKEKEGREFFALILDKKPFPQTKYFASILYGDGLFAYRLGDTALSRKRNNEALRIAKKFNDAKTQGLVFLGLSRVEYSERNFDESRKFAIEANDFLEQFGPEYSQPVLGLLALATKATGNLIEAEPLFEQSLELNRKLNDENMIIVELHNLGHIEVQLGKVDEAEKHFDECEKLSGNTNNPYDMALNIFSKATIANARGNKKQARLLVKEARKILIENNIVLAIEDEDDLSKLESLLNIK